MGHSLRWCGGDSFAAGRVRGHPHVLRGDERVLIISGLFGQQVKSLALRALSDVSLMAYGDGSGTITFGSTAFASGFNPAGSWPGTWRYLPPGFDRIEEARDVYEIIRSAQKAVRVSSDQRPRLGNLF